MKRELAIEFSRVTEAAALAGYKWLGRGDKNTADGAAVNAMRIMLNLVNIDGTIVIGEGGRKIKEIGQATRKQLEALLGKKVYLDLEVKVYPDWRKDPEALRELGYRSSVG